MLFGKDDGYFPPEENRDVFNRCDVCGESIRTGDQYYDLGMVYIHKDCLDEMPRSEILEIIGIKEETA